MMHMHAMQIDATKCMTLHVRSFRSFVRSFVRSMKFRLFDCMCMALGTDSRVRKSQFSLRTMGKLRSREENNQKIEHYARTQTLLSTRSNAQLAQTLRSSTLLQC